MMKGTNDKVVSKVLFCKIQYVAQSGKLPVCRVWQVCTPEKLPTKFPCTLGVGENLASCHHGWCQARKFLKTWSPRCQKWYLQCHTVADCTKLFPVHTNIFKTICLLWEDITYIFVDKFCTHYLGLTKSAHLHLRFCLAHTRTRARIEWAQVGQIECVVDGHLNYLQFPVSQRILYPLKQCPPQDIMISGYSSVSMDSVS